LFLQPADDFRSGRRRANALGLLQALPQNLIVNKPPGEGSALRISKRPIWLGDGAAPAACLLLARRVGEGANSHEDDVEGKAFRTGPLAKLACVRHPLGSRHQGGCGRQCLRVIIDQEHETFASNGEYHAKQLFSSTRSVE